MDEDGLEALQEMPMGGRIKAGKDTVSTTTMYCVYRDSVKNRLYIP